MNILFVRNNPSYPALYAGTENALHGLALRLVHDGHKVVFASVGKDKAEFVTEKYGYQTFRSDDVTLATNNALSNFRPDVCVVIEIGAWMLELGEKVLKLPLVCYQHNIHEDLKTLTIEVKRKVRFIANSKFTRHVLGLLNIPSVVVPPIFGIEKYAGVEPEKRKYAVFVSLQERKGFSVCKRLAERRPERRFAFVNSWGTKQENLDQLKELDNVTIVRNQPDLKSVFKKTRLVVMPSLSSETWGLTATEALVSKIPVLASNGGNLPNTVGSGGLVVPLTLEMDYWLYAFDKFYEPNFYSDMPQKATARGEQLLRDIDSAYSEFCGVLDKAAVQTIA